MSACRRSQRQKIHRRNQRHDGHDANTVIGCKFPAVQTFNIHNTQPGSISASSGVGKMPRRNFRSARMREFMFILGNRPVARLNCKRDSDTSRTRPSGDPRRNPRTFAPQKRRRFFGGRQRRHHHAQKSCAEKRTWRMDSGLPTSIGTSSAPEKITALIQEKCL